jgi:UDP:flavonoid glycosyltransferase YjiC (YdhE family)
MTVVFYVSGHGFGHASREIEIIDALLARRPDLRVIVRTSARRWLFDLTLRHPVEILALECDTGIVQIDSLRLDEAGSIRRAAAFHRDLQVRAAREAQYLGSVGASLVVGDIPPLAFAAADLARLPSIAISNFTWDWIYEGYADEVAGVPDLIPTIRDAYRRARLTLRLPMWGGFASMADGLIRDIPFVARRSSRTRDEVRRGLGLPDDCRLVLLSFGGFGLRDFDLGALSGLPGYAVISTGHVGASARGAALPPHLVEIDENHLYGAGYRYEDLVAASDVVVTKPGYGIIAECVANGAAVLYTSRGHFVEYDVLVEAMPRFVRSRFIPQSELFAGRWAPHLDALIAQPPPSARPAVNGADIAADVVLEQLQGVGSSQ